MVIINLVLVPLIILILIITLPTILQILRDIFVSVFKLKRKNYRFPSEIRRDEYKEMLGKLARYQYVRSKSEEYYRVNKKMRDDDFICYLYNLTEPKGSAFEKAKKEIADLYAMSPREDYGSGSKRIIYKDKNGISQSISETEF